VDISGKFFWTKGSNENDSTKASNTLNLRGAALKANKGMAKKQPSKRTEISIQTVTVCVIQSGLMGSMGFKARAGFSAKFLAIP
jgi:hypothetical protein